MKRVHYITRRRGAVVVQVAVCGALLLSFAALAVDTGRMYAARVELQSAVDSAAMAAVSGYLSDTGLRQNRTQMQTLCGARGIDSCGRNNLGRTSLVLAGSDVVLGKHNYASPNAPMDQSAGVRFNAAELTVRMSEGSANGRLSLVFAPIFGQHYDSQIAIARAVLDDRFAGLHLDVPGYANLMPFTMDKTMYDDMVLNGLDEWSLSAGAPVETGDGIREVKLYPWKLKGNGGDPIYESQGAGNFGILQFGGSGTPIIVNQIINGMTPDEIAQGIGGGHELVFTDASGNPVRYNISGTPGMRSAMAAAFEARIGQVVGFFVHDQYSGGGTNLTYRVMGLRFGRIMDVKLNGNPPQRRVVIQPVTFSGPSAFVRQGAPSSNGQVGRIMLVR